MKLVLTLDGKDNFSTWDVENVYDFSYQRYCLISLFLLLTYNYNSISEIY